MINWCNYMLGTTTILVHYSNPYSGVKKVQRWDFVYLPSLLYHPYLVYIISGKKKTCRNGMPVNKVGMQSLY